MFFDYYYLIYKMTNNFSNCDYDPPTTADYCDLIAKKQMSDLATARVVIEFLSFLGFMIVATYTFLSIKGQKAGLLTVELMLAMSTFLGGLAYSKVNNDKIPIVVEWNIT